ncbi:hypothetical protein CYMTET_16676 [Cymbomonas tetramitiformis]|uniref:Uncharacterized protein n=1 Tax=Cymbomonas tetramitiformis TaxID=36881 RepID=A0AAE0GBP0_9CHLO|nr:hypothetical protein CYMTET_16676 [Cymbomonas tetramitiformis]
MGACSHVGGYTARMTARYTTCGYTCMTAQGTPRAVYTRMTALWHTTCGYTCMTAQGAAPRAGTLYGDRAVTPRAGCICNTAVSHHTCGHTCNTAQGTPQRGCTCMTALWYTTCGVESRRTRKEVKLLKESIWWRNCRYMGVIALATILLIYFFWALACGANLQC